MGTLAELKSRIIGEIDRDDMGSGDESEQRLVDAITDAIDYYSDRLFWFNRASGTTSTVAATATASLPSGVRYPDRVSYSGEILQKIPLDEIDYRTETGQPTHWAANGDVIQLWPIPDAAYSLAVKGLADSGYPASDGTSNIWTTEAVRLIAESAKRRLNTIYKDFEAAGAAGAAEQDELSRLNRETRRRGVTPLRSDVPQARSTFNINQGY